MAPDDYESWFRAYRFNDRGEYTYYTKLKTTSLKPTRDDNNESASSSDNGEVLVIACIIILALLVIIILLALCLCLKKHYFSTIDQPEHNPEQAPSTSGAGGGGTEVASTNEAAATVAGGGQQTRRYQPLPVVPQILSTLGPMPDTQSTGAVAPIGSSSANKPESSKISKTRIITLNRKRKSTIGGGRKNHRRSQYQLQQQQQKQKSQFHLDRSAPITAEMFNSNNTNNISTKGEEVILFKALSFNE